MQQEASDTFVRVKRDGLETMVLTTVAGGKTDPPIAYVEEPVVRDRDAVGRAADRVQDLLRTCKRRLGVDNPCLGIQLGTERCEARRASSACGLLRAGQGTGGPEPGPRLTALPAKDGTQGAHRKQEAGIGLEPARPVGGERTGRDHAVHMDMRPKVWSHVCRTMVHPICPPRLRCPHCTSVWLAAWNSRVNRGLLWAKISGLRSWGTVNTRWKEGTGGRSAWRFSTHWTCVNV